MTHIERKLNAGPFCEGLYTWSAAQANCLSLRSSPIVCIMEESRTEYT